MTWYLGAETNAYTSAIGRMFLVSMIARVMKPGCQVDYMLVLEGQQGAGKSSAAGILGGRWYSDGLPDDVSKKDAAQHLRGKWLVEVGELQALSKSETAAFKSFLTRRVEIYRPPYGRLEVREPRQCVFVGSTNQAVYLRDETGGRRFWPVRCCDTLDLAGLERDRDQLLAEAVRMYESGVRWWPDRAFERTCIAPEQAARYDADAWQEAVQSYVNSHERVTVQQVANNALSLETARIGRAEQNRIMAILQQLGWTRGKRHGGARWWLPAVTVTHNDASSNRGM